MYLSHFNLKIKPFRISPDPKFLWLGETHKEALAMLKYSIQDNRGFLLLSGDIGTGKTTLINGLLESLDDQTLVAMVSDPGLEKLDFYNFLTHAFDMQKTFKNKGDFLVHFIHFLHKAHADNKKVLIIIDEAQRLSYELLEEIRQLSNIEKKDTKLLNVFLVGQHELIDALNETRNRALLQRITLKYLIGPLDHEDVPEYIAFRLKVAGTDKKIFTSGAIRQIIAFSNGYPRLINIICDHALLTTYVKGKQKVDAAIIRECAKDLQIKVELPKSGRINTRLSGRLVNAIKNPFRKPFLGIFLYLAIITLIAVIVIAILFRVGMLSAWKPTTQFQIKESPIQSISSKKKPVKKTSTEPLAAPTISLQASNQASDLSGTTTENRDNMAAIKKQTPLPFQEKIFTVRFPLDSNEFSQEAYSLLDEIIGIARQHPEVLIDATGYTDSVGNTSYNQQLSRFRAMVVKSYLVGNNVQADRVRIDGKGPENPVATNDTPEGRQLNRRVELRLFQKSN